MEILPQEILTELKAIKWILIILAIAFLYFAFSLLFWLKSIAKDDGALGKRIKHKERGAELEELLNKGDPLGAKFTALEWTTSYPNDPWAHWYLARAYDQLGEYVETRKCLIHIQKISPSWNESIEPWLESVEKNLSPRGVK